MEQSDGVGTAAHAGHQRVRQPALGTQHLTAGFLADAGVKIAHHHRIGMRPATVPIT